MKVTVTVSGGLAPGLVGRQFGVDSAALGADGQRTLDQVVDAALAAPAVASNPQARDVRSYSITIESGATTHTIEAEDGAISEPVRKLVDAVKSLAG